MKEEVMFVRYLASVLCLFCVCEISSIRGQETSQSHKLDGFVVPRDVILSVVASQPDCPLQFEEVKHVKFLIGGSGDVYQLRNRGTKPIRAYTIAVLSTTGIGWNSSWPRKLAERPLLPGEAVPRPEEPPEVEIVPMTEKLREKAKLPKQMQAVSVLMIVRVEYTDGSVYSDEQAYKALQAYFQNIALVLEAKPQERH